MSAPEIVYYVAASLDGYIAGPSGEVDWLSQVDRPGEDYGYAEFYASVDALLMGSKTYEFCLDFEWPYPGKHTWVFSRRNLQSNRPDVTITSAPPNEIVRVLQERGCKRVWLVGGGVLAAAFQAEHLISEYIVSIIPVVLGEGLQLLAPSGTEAPLTLVDSKVYESGLVQLRYLRRK